MIKKKIDVSLIVSFIFFSLCCIVTILLINGTATIILDSDASSEMVLANLLSQKNQILTTSWAYSTELRVLNTQLVFGLLFKFFTDWGVVRSIGTLILHGILVGSYYFFTRQAKLSLKTFFITGGLLLIPFSVTYARIVLIHSYYIPHLAIGFLVLGLIFALGNNKSKKSLKTFYLVCLCILSFLSGLGGIRQFLVTFVPLGMTCFLLLVLSGGFQSFASTTIQQRKFTLVAFKSLYSTLEMKNFIHSCIAFLFAFSAFLVNKFILSTLFIFETFDDLQIIFPQLGQLKLVAKDFFEIFGYQKWTPLSTMEGKLSMLSVAGIVILGGLVLYLLFNIKKIKQPAWKMILTFFTVTMGLNFITFMVTQRMLSLYHIPVAIYLFPIIAILLEKLDLSFSKLRKGIVLISIMTLLLNTRVVYDYLMTQSEDSKLFYFGLQHNSIHDVRNITPAAQFLQDNNYRFGYATFWNTNIVTELTDGQVEVVCVESLNETLQANNWLTVLDYQHEDYYQGKTFILLTRDQAGFCISEKYDWFVELKLVFEDKDYMIYESDDLLIP